MPTRWMRWNVGTHIFEISSDGVAFSPMPLNASCITEGTLSPSVIPGGGGGASLTADNVWTGINTHSGVAPVLRFTETDAAANQKNWDIGPDIASFKIKTLNDALTGVVNLFSIDRNGNLTVSAVSTGNHSFNASVDGYNLLHVVNSSAGVSAGGGMMMQNNVGDGRAYLVLSSSANTNAAFLPDALNLYSAGNGGLLINSAGAAPVVIRTSNAARVTIAANGAVTFAAGVTINGALSGAAISATDINCNNLTAAVNVVSANWCYSFGNPIGYWRDVAYSGSYFTAANGVWTVEAGDMTTYAFVISGKMMTVSFELNGTSVSAATPELRIAIPIGAAPVRTMTNSVWSNGANGDTTIWHNLIATAAAGVGYIALKPISPSQGVAANFAATSNLTTIRGQITFWIN